jgi:hypothetical protein
MSALGSVGVTFVRSIAAPCCNGFTSNLPQDGHLMTLKPTLLRKICKDRE